MQHKTTHGGKRKGAGRKGFGGTTLVRVPNGILKLVKKIISDWKAAAIAVITLSQ